MKKASLIVGSVAVLGSALVLVGCEYALPGSVKQETSVEVQEQMMTSPAATSSPMPLSSPSEDIDTNLTEMDKLQGNVNGDIYVQGMSDTDVGLE